MIGLAKVITFGIQKGGVSKTTTTGITAYLMAQEGYKVLVVDMDSQGNVTNLLTQMEQVEYEGQTILQAIQEGDAKPYIVNAAKNIDVLPADDFLSAFPRWLYTEYIKTGKHQALAVSDLLDTLKPDYDFILIDTPPSLSEQTTNSVCASDYAVMLAESSKWAFTAIPRFMETINFVKEAGFNENIQIAGILRSMNDARRYDSKAFVELIGEEYPDLVFETVIKRKAATGRLAFQGFSDNKELNEAIEMYEQFYHELKQRIGVE